MTDRKKALEWIEGLNKWLIGIGCTLQKVHIEIIRESMSEPHCNGCAAGCPECCAYLRNPVIDDYNEQLHKTVMRFGAGFMDMEECRVFEKDIIRIFAREPVIDDAALREAVTIAELMVLKSPCERSALQTLITHTMKGQSK